LERRPNSPDHTFRLPPRDTDPLAFLDPVESSSELGRSLIASLSRHPDKVGTVSHVSLGELGRGRHNTVVLARLDHDPHRLITLRFPTALDNPRESSYNLRSEYHALSRLPRGVAPEAYYWDTDDPEQPILAAQYIHGHTIPYAMWQDKTLKSMGQKIALTHTVREAPVLPTDLRFHFLRGKVNDHLESLHSYRARVFVGRVLRELDPVLERAQSLFKDAPYDSFTQNDYAASNIIVSPDESDVRLIDWEFAEFFHPDLDLASFYLPGPQFRNFRAGLDPRRERLFIDAYEEIAGHDPNRLERIRVGHKIDLARMIVSLIALLDNGTTESFGMTPEEAGFEYDILMDTFRSLGKIA